MGSKTLCGVVLVAAALVFYAAIPGHSQAPPAPVPPGTPPSPQQLDDLVAPIALYPDPLVGQVLAASTYPAEIVEADQWIRDHPKWKPSKLMDKAKKEKWDPSVQALVAFPNVVAMLSQNLNWTTQLGNAFLADQAAVMQAVQRMRAQAEAKGTLHSTPQEIVNTQEQNGQSVITIEPADPDVWYVPDYNPVYVWGPPVWGVYPVLIYPGIGIGIGWWPGIDIGLWFGGWGGWAWGGWGWMPDWYGGEIFIDHSFFHRYGFRDFRGGGFTGRSAWVHDPEHRLGVPYASPEVAGRYARGGGFGGRPEAAPGQRFGTRGFEQRGWTGNHSVFGGYHDGGMARMQSDRGFSSMGGERFGGFRGGGFGGGGFHGGGRR